MTPSPGQSADGVPFLGLLGDGWVPPDEAFAVVLRYLSGAPEQGDWDWEDHCAGLASGVLHALHDAGWQLHNDGFLRSEGS